MVLSAGCSGFTFSILHNLTVTHLFHLSIFLSVFICARQRKPGSFTWTTCSGCSMSKRNLQQAASADQRFVNKGNYTPVIRGGHESPLTATREQTQEWHLFDWKVTLWSHKSLQLRMKRPVEQKKEEEQLKLLWQLLGDKPLSAAAAMGNSAISQHHLKYL